jgi:hypothetical protein
MNNAPMLAIQLSLAGILCLHILDIADKKTQSAELAMGLSARCILTLSHRRNLLRSKITEFD